MDIFHAKSSYLSRVILFGIKAPPCNKYNKKKLDNKRKKVYEISREQEMCISLREAFYE